MYDILYLTCLCNPNGVKKLRDLYQVHYETRNIYYSRGRPYDLISLISDVRYTPTNLYKTVVKGKLRSFPYSCDMGESSYRCPVPVLRTARWITSKSYEPRPLWVGSLKALAQYRGINSVNACGISLQQPATLIDGVARLIKPSMIVR